MKEDETRTNSVSGVSDFGSNDPEPQKRAEVACLPADDGLSGYDKKREAVHDDCRADEVNNNLGSKTGKENHHPLENPYIAVPYLSDYGYTDLPLLTALDASRYQAHDEDMKSRIQEWSDEVIKHHLKSDVAAQDREYTIKRIEVISDIVTNVGALIGSIGLSIGFQNPAFLGIMAIPSIAVAINIIGNTFGNKRADRLSSPPN